MFLIDIIFYYSLTAIQTITVLYIKWIPYVSFTGGFLDIVIGRYFRQGMGKKTATEKAECVYHFKFSLDNLANDVMPVS